MRESVTVDGEKIGCVASRKVVFICVCLALLPFLALCFKEIRYGLYFPYWDAWHFSLFLQKAAGEGLSFGDFWAQHNEHRIVFPRLIMFALARASGWNVALELVVNVILGLGIFFLLCRMAFRGHVGGRHPWWIVPAFSFFVFSWVQMENWVWGWQMQVFLSTAAVVTGAWALGRTPLKPAAFLLALCAGIVASFSFANGVLYWIAMAPLIFFAPGLKKEPRLIYSLLWIAVGVLVIQFYLLGYNKPSVSPSMSSVLQNPLQVIGYVIVYVGAPVTGIFTRPSWHGVDLPVGPGHFIAGSLALGALPAMVLLILRRNKDAYPALLPWISLALYALGSATITAAGRAGFGLEQAMTSRYTTISTLYWCALIAVVAIFMQQKPLTAFQCPHRRRVYGGLAVLLFVVGVFWSHHSQRGWEQNCHWKRMGWNGLRAGHFSPLYLQDLCWDPIELRDRFLPILREGHWAGFGGDPYRPMGMADAYVDDAEQFLDMGFHGQAKVYLETALLLDEDNVRAREQYEALKGSAGNTPGGGGQ